MVMTTVASTTCDPPLIDRLRHVLDGADDILLCVAFVTEPGVQLLRRQLGTPNRVRLLTTTTFGTTTNAALELARDLGIDIRTLNPPAGTYHPKIYLARNTRHSSVVIGSANLTSGLVSNIEACTITTGNNTELDDTWQIAERLWDNPRASTWQPTLTGPGEAADVGWDDLLGQLAAVAPPGSEIRTLGPRPHLNRIDRIDTAGVWIETDRSRQRRTGPQLVNTWMLRLAYDYLTFHGELTNRYLLADNGLNVKRSSAVCALLAQLPEITVTNNNPIELTHTPT